MRKDILVGSTSSNLSKKIDNPYVRCECEVQAGPDSLDIPVERKTRRNTTATQVGVVRCKYICQSLNIIRRAPIHEIDILGRASRTMGHCCDAANDNQFNSAVQEEP